MPSVLRPLRSYPLVVRKRLWQIQPFDRRTIYSTRMATPTLLTVLAEGHRELHRRVVKRDLPGRFAIVKQWLVYESYPRAAERHRRDMAAAAATKLAEARALAKARANPAFKAFTRRLGKELGLPRKARACDRDHLAYRAPSDARCAELIQEARRSGASATLYLAPWGRELRVVPGGVGALAALFDWNTYGPRVFDRALEALDADAGFTLDHVWDWDELAFHLDRVPRKPATYAKVIADALGLSESVVLAGMKRRGLIVGRDPSAWRKLFDGPRDPGTEDDDEDDH